MSTGPPGGQRLLHLSLHPARHVGRLCGRSPCGREQPGLSASCFPFVMFKTVSLVRPMRHQRCCLSAGKAARPRLPRGTGPAASLAPGPRTLRESRPLSRQVWGRHAAAPHDTARRSWRSSNATAEMTGRGHVTTRNRTREAKQRADRWRVAPAHREAGACRTHARRASSETAWAPLPHGAACGAELHSLPGRQGSEKAEAVHGDGQSPALTPCTGIRHDARRVRTVAGCVRHRRPVSSSTHTALPVLTCRALVLGHWNRPSGFRGLILPICFPASTCVAGNRSQGECLHQGMWQKRPAQAFVSLTLDSY